MHLWGLDKHPIISDLLASFWVLSPYTGQLTTTCNPHSRGYYTLLWTQQTSAWTCAYTHIHTLAYGEIHKQILNILFPLPIIHNLESQSEYARLLLVFLLRLPPRFWGYKIRVFFFFSILLFSWKALILLFYVAMMVTNSLSCSFPFHMRVSWLPFDFWKVLLLGVSVWVDMFYFVLDLKSTFPISEGHVVFMKFSSFGLFGLCEWSAMVRYRFLGLS